MTLPVSHTLNDAHSLAQLPAQIRQASMVMRLSRLGSFFPTRLSFMRVLIRQLAEQKSVLKTQTWSLDKNGFGRAVLSINLFGREYSLIAFTQPLSDENRTDRVIAEAWDSTYVLYDGIPETEDLDRLEQQVPNQEAGRYSDKELVLSRANKSVRLFQHVVDQLSEGKQPDFDLIKSTGYLMRTTAVYGNGKFGIADRAKIAKRNGMSGPFQIEMLAVYLIREFTHRLVEHIAKCKSPKNACLLSDKLKRYLGIGNSTGLGMAPFLVSHPVLLNNWMLARETAIANMRSIHLLDQTQKTHITKLYYRAKNHLSQWQTTDITQTKKISCLRQEWQKIEPIFLDKIENEYPLEELVQLTNSYSLEMQELMVSLIVEIGGDEIDQLTHCMTSDISPYILPNMSLKFLKNIIKQQFNWALSIDFSQADENHQFWYTSATKLEPRLGERYSEDGAEKEQPLDIAKQVQALNSELEKHDDHQITAIFILKHPEFRYIIKRIQTASWAPYGEIQDNLIGKNCKPIDMLRCKLSFFGAAKFDPKSDRWTRITLYQGAPTASELRYSDADNWWLPVLE
ncbi:hypothetical protein N9C75_00225 [Alphaproteobacteria bacterium]|jgi:hypothetical protein|nr:hypothetical protein [Alphaproteobacteria bacterium]MDC3311299.1 hypothetical protein [Alphaproteobacteria bacterium]